MTTVDRWLEFEGLSNIRDVGGLPLEGGGTTRAGVLLRSEALIHLTEGDVRLLVDGLDLRLVLDLRTEREIVRTGPSPLVAAGVETVQFSFIPETGLALPELDGEVEPMVAHYLGYLHERGEAVVGAVRRLVAADGASLVHCAAGKDRTGTLVALVLDAVGVERAAVVEDYALSATRIDAMFARWARAAAVDLPSAEELDKHRPKPESMARVLEVLDERDGGAVGWLQANGLTDAELDTLRRRLTFDS